MSNFVQSSLFGAPGFVRSSNSAKGTKRRKLSSKSQVSTVSSNEVVELVNDEFKEKDKISGGEEMSRRQRARAEWNEAWVKTFDWAVFDRETSRIFCAFCKQDPKSKSEFGKSGSINVQMSALTDHAKTNAHKLASYQCGAKKISITETIGKRKDKADRASRILFSAAYQVAKHDMSFCTFEHNLELLQVSNCDCVPLEMYRNDKACAMFVQYISESILKSQIAKIKLSPFFSLMLDESTDIGSKQNLIVYVSFLDNHEPMTMFLGLIELENSTSSCLFETCIDFLGKYELDISKMICFGSDGASTMIGSRIGVSTRLKRENPFMTNIHCIAHRSSLCLADAVKEFPIAQELDACMNSLASLFSRSALRTKALENLQVELNGSVLHLTRIHAVRWLSRQIVVKKVCESLEAILTYTKTENATLFEKLANFQFMYNLHFMSDVLDRLGMLSKVFQSDFVDVSAVASFIDLEIRALEMFFIEDPVVDINASTHDRYSYHIIPGYGPIDGQLHALRTSIRGDQYRSIQISRKEDGSDLESCIVFQKAFVNCIIENLRQRFSDNGVMGCFKSIAPCSFPKKREVFRDFGNLELEKLVDFYGVEKVSASGVRYGSLVQKLETKREYQYFKLQAPFEWSEWSLKDTWVAIAKNSTMKEKYPMLLTLANIALLQCCSTAACERGFSKQNLIKSKLRNHLNVRTVESLMRISIEGPSLRDFDFSDAIEMWRLGAKTSRHLYGDSIKMTDMG
ncbi:hypothetical protein L7F22_018824 [Adiantum nelumboides]|nr:hypothetical protein [Adiantum nelumboides]